MDHRPGTIAITTTTEILIEVITAASTTGVTITTVTGTEISGAIAMHGITGTDWETGPTWTYTETWWLIPGPFTGIGPRGFQRSDDRIREDVNDRLTQHGQIDATEIQVNVNNGEVTLRGTVNSRREKRMAEDVAETVFGVTDVHNQLRVQQTGMDTGQFGQTGMQGQLREGMDVVGRDGGHIGTVKEVRGNKFLVDRPKARDIFVPFSACNVSGGQVQLNVRANEVDNQGWRTPEVIETPKTR